MTDQVGFSIGSTVRAFDPRTMGVVKIGKVMAVKPTVVLINFGVLHGTTWVTFADILEEISGPDHSPS